MIDAGPTTRGNLLQKLRHAQGSPFGHRRATTAPRVGRARSGRRSAGRSAAVSTQTSFSHSSKRRRSHASRSPVSRISDIDLTPRPNVCSHDEEHGPHAHRDGRGNEERGAGETTASLSNMTASRVSSLSPVGQPRHSRSSRRSTALIPGGKTTSRYRRRPYLPTIASKKPHRWTPSSNLWHHAADCRRPFPWRTGTAHPGVRTSHRFRCTPRSIRRTRPKRHPYGKSAKPLRGLIGAANAQPGS